MCLFYALKSHKPIYQRIFVLLMKILWKLMWAGFVAGMLILTGKIGYAQEPDRVYSLGAGVMINRAFADVAEAKYTPAVFGAYYNHLTEYATLSIEAQLGKIAGGNQLTDPYKRQFSNYYGAVLFCADVQAGTFFAIQETPAKNTLRNIYAGSGIGVLFNSMRFIQRSPVSGNTPYAGADKSTNFLLPLRFGYELKFADNRNEIRYRVDVGYQFNFTFSEGLDGYDEPVSGNKNPDMYGQFALIFKYAL